MDLDKIHVILATDCGSTTTKAILIEKVDGVFRQTFRGEAPTTVEEPVADVTVGVINAATEVGELAGRKLVNEKGELIRPARDGEGCDIYISTSSAGGGLQMMVAGIVREMTAASAKRAALGAGAIVMDVIAANDKRLPHEQIQRIRELRPDMILVSGGTDGGNTAKVVEIAERIAPARPQPRFGKNYQMPLIYAGNKDAADLVRTALGDSVELFVVPNLRPVLEHENLGPARDRIHDIFLEHVMAHAPGYDKLIRWSDAPIMPTPGAVGDILQMIAKREGINAVGVDIGGATTDVFSVFSGTFNRTVSANLGMSYSISNVCAEAGMANVLRWVHVDMDERALRNRVKNKMIRPTTIPQTLGALIFEQAVSREALRLAYVQHKEFATTLKGVQQQRTVGDLFSQEKGGRSIVDNMVLDLLVASGGVLSHAPRMQQTAAMLIDAFEPEGITTLAKDSIFMMPHLGVLAQVHPQAAIEVFERDCLIYLGTCVSPKGSGSLGKNCFRYTLARKGNSGAPPSESGEIAVGEMRLLSLGPGELATITVEPARGFDCGAGPGKRVEKEIRGGTVGLILDGRGRPLVLPEDNRVRQKLLTEWIRALDSVSVMATYTPGLKVVRQVRHRMRRVLPIAGDVLVKVGDRVDAEQIVAQTFMPGDVTPLNLANVLSISPGDVKASLLKQEGEKVEVGELLARTKGIFGLFKNEYRSKSSGTLESVSAITGQVILRGQPMPVQVRAYLTGTVIEVLPKEGVVIEADVTLIQGIFGIGGEAYGPIKMACGDPSQELTAALIKPEMKGAIVVGGGRMDGEAIRKAVSVGVSALVSGGIDDQDLKEALGYDLGVAVTGSEKIGLTLIVTEGFGDIAMAERTFRLLASRAGAAAAVNGATQIRAGVMRPEIIVPIQQAGKEPSIDESQIDTKLEVGATVRIIRDPYFGRIGKVSALPHELRTLDSESKARVLEVAIDSQERIIVPRANVELIES